MAVERQNGTSDEVTTGLTEVGEQWSTLGRTDPLWAVLTEPGKKKRAWDVDEFLATGEREIDGVMQAVSAVGLTPGRGTALDFGCGAGRLVQALATHFERVIGVDIAKPMIATAEDINRKGTACHFVHNEQSDLAVVDSDSMDFVYSCRVLQHMPTVLSSRYIAEFVRVIKADTGVAVFQMPSHPAGTLLGRLMRVLPKGIVTRVRKMQMHGLSSEQVSDIVRGAGGEIVTVDVDHSAGPHWVSNRYIVRHPVHQSGSCAA